MPSHPSAPQRWREMTLADLRAIADASAGGVAWEAIRSGGRIAVLVVCVVEPHRIALLERLLDLPDDGTGVDWNDHTPADLMGRALGESGCCFEALRDELCAAFEAVARRLSFSDAAEELCLAFGLKP